MALTLTTRPATPPALTPPTRIQHFQGIEFPGPGAWTLGATSSAVISTRRHVVAARIAAGALVVPDPPIGTSLDLAFTAPDGTHTRLDADAVGVEENGDGFVRFHMIGRLRVDDAPDRPITVTLDHRGVYRNGTRFWAWLTARVEPSDAPRRRRETIHLDLLAHAPGGPA